MTEPDSHISYKHLCAFFIPLGLSSSLTSITHVIINGTLSRGEHAAYIIACYAIAFSLFGIVEKPMIIFRQTSSALVRDLRSFKVLTILFFYVTTIILIISLIISYSFIGEWIFIQLFNANTNMVNTISKTFQVITVVIVLSGIRGIYQGIIINHRETKWITIGVILRLASMLIVAYWFVSTEKVSSMVGAAIFLTGMLVECLVSVWKGHRIIKSETREREPRLSKSDFLQFYTPLALYFIFQTMLIPIVYMFLAKTNQIELGIASFALAYTICQLMLSFFMFTHQIVLQFYKQNKQKVIRFMFFLSIIPTFFLCLLCFTPVGYWFMDVIMGTEKSLADPTLYVLQFFIIRTLLFPWVDFFSGIIMLQRRTRRMLLAQAINLITVVISLLFFVHYLPHLNGVIGAMAASLGELAGLIAVIIIVYKANYNNKVRAG